jgi:hypothetical protein
LRGICVFFQQSIEFINPLFDANYGVFRRASDDSVSGRYLPRFKRFELPLKRRSHLNPVLNQIVYCRHSATSLVFAEHSRKIAPERGRIKGLKFQTGPPPLFVIRGVQVFERDRRNPSARLVQPDARRIAIRELDARRFERGADSGDIVRHANSRTFARFHSAQRRSRNIRGLRQIGLLEASDSPRRCNLPACYFSAIAHCESYRLTYRP